MKSFLLVVLIFLVKSTVSNAENVSCPDGSPSQGNLSVTGQGSVSNIPDLATINLRVEVTAKTAAEAREAGAVAVNATLGALAALGIPTSDISTSAFSIYPKTEYNPTTGASTQTGTTFAEDIVVKIPNVTAEYLGAVVDGAVAAGGNAVQVSSVTTSLSPTTEKAALNEARKLAVADGLSTASVLAQAAGVTAGPVTSITDSSSSPPTPYPMPVASGDAAEASATPTQIVIGDSETQASVALVLAICK